MNIPHAFNPLGGGKKSELPPGFKPLAFYGPMNKAYTFDINAQYDDTYRLVYKNDIWKGGYIFNWYDVNKKAGFGIDTGYYDGDFFTMYFGIRGGRLRGANLGIWHEVEMGPVDDTRYYSILDGEKIIVNKPDITWNPNRWLYTTTHAESVSLKEFELLRNGERVCKLLPAIGPDGEKCIVDIVTGKTYKPT